VLTSIITLRFNQNPIRVASIDGQPWFIAADVVKALGIQNCTVAVKALGKDEVRLAEVIAQRRVHALSVQGLRRKLNRSLKPEAPALLEWAEREAIQAYREAVKTVPAVQRTGSDAVSRLAAKIAELERQIATLSASSLHASQTPSPRPRREFQT